MTLLTVEGLSVGFPNRRAGSWLKAVHDVSFTLQAGELLGMVGESGCGKSLTSLSLLRLPPAPGQILSGSIVFEGQSLLSLDAERMRRLRGSRIALIPQDPMTALNPVYTIGSQLAEVMTTHQGLSRKTAWQRAADLLDRVRMPQAASRLHDYPHQFSGGMRQRVMIAMALSCAPSLLVADEPTTALDVTVQAQILALLQEIQRDSGMAVLLVTHDLGVVAEVCDRVLVMYAGRIVEAASVAQLFANPQHPYTQGLLACLPNPDLGHQALRIIEGQPPPLDTMPPGCAFAPRCPEHRPLCDERMPDLILQAGHGARCILVSPQNNH